MSLLWEGVALTEHDVKFLKSIRVSADAGHESFQRDYGKRKERDSKIGTYFFYAGLVVLIAACYWGR